jgi:hypothetical protein
MHGGKSPGAPRGERNGRYVHGRYVAEELVKRRALAATLRSGRLQNGTLRELLDQIRAKHGLDGQVTPADAQAAEQKQRPPKPPEMEPA